MQQIYFGMTEDVWSFKTGLRSPPSTTSSTRSFSKPSPGPAKDLITKLLKVSPEERISAEEIMKHPWQQDYQFIRRANARMVTQLRGSKRLVEEVDEEVIHEEVIDYPFNLFEFKF